MPSLADRARLEWVLRGVALLAFGWLATGAWLARPREGSQVLAGPASQSALHEWAVQPPADSLGLQLAVPPDPSERDFLRALVRNGTAVVWSSGGIVPLMLEAEPLQDPAGGLVARVTAPSGSTIELSDTLGPIDSLRIDRVGATLRLPTSAHGLFARTGSSRASVAPAPGANSKAIVVLGAAGWESKFTVRALEERGWKVAARLALAPRLHTESGAPFPLDTARHAAVIALDSTAAPYAAAIGNFVSRGGGLILGGDAIGGLGRLAPAGWGPMTRSAVGRSVDARASLAWRSLNALAAGASALELRGDRVAVAAWRLGSGRVIQSGYRDTWRWRMEGGESSVADHRAWWAALVAAVAQRPMETMPAADPAPLASLSLAFGPSGPLPSAQPAHPLWPFVLAVLILSLFAEWISRRLRGAA